MSAIYNLRTIPNGWQVTKFDDDFNLESSYEMTSSDGVVRCGCPAGARPTCRHRQMFPELLTRLDTGWFLDFDTKQWVDPTGEARRVEQDSPTGADAMAYGAASAASSSDPHPREQHQSAEGWIDSGTIKFVEEQAPPEPIVKVEDSHPFRRRM